MVRTGEDRRGQDWRGPEKPTWTKAAYRHPGRQAGMQAALAWAPWIPGAPPPVFSWLPALRSLVGQHCLPILPSLCARAQASGRCCLT